MAVRLLSLVHQDCGRNTREINNKVHGERIKQGNFGQVWRSCHTDPDGLQTIVVIKEVTYTPESAWQKAHELECLRRPGLYAVIGTSCLGMS